MANINISNLKPNGYELFSDSENYMMDLSENELGNVSLDNVNGGFLSPVSFIVSAVKVTAAVSKITASGAILGGGFGLSYATGRN